MQVVSIVILAMCGVAMIRSSLVYRYSIRLITSIHNANIKSINKGKYSKVSQRWDEYNKVSFHRMTAQFWRKCSSFYDPEFLKEIGMK